MNPPISRALHMRVTNGTIVTIWTSDDPLRMMIFGPYGTYGKWSDDMLLVPTLMLMPWDRKRMHQNPEDMPSYKLVCELNYVAIL